MKAAARGGFQIVKEEKAKEILQPLPSKPVQPIITRKKHVSTHDEVKERLVMLGKLQV